MGKLDEAGVEGFDFALGEIFEKTAESDEVVSLGNGLEIFAVAVDFAVELEAIFADEFGGDIGRSEVRKISIGSIDGAKLGVFLKNAKRNILEAEKVALVVFGSFAGAAAFDFEMFDEVANEFGDIHKYIIAYRICKSDGEMWYNVRRWPGSSIG